MTTNLLNNVAHLYITGIYDYTSDAFFVHNCEERRATTPFSVLLFLRGLLFYANQTKENHFYVKTHHKKRFLKSIGIVENLLQLSESILIHFCSMLLVLPLL